VALVRVVIFRPGSTPETTSIEDDLRAMQAIVEGNLEAIKIAPSVYAHVNEDGRTQGKPTCAFVAPAGDVVVGPCFVAAMDDDGKPRSLTDAEVAVVLKTVTPVAFVSSERFEA
jgi:hypothetical protein